LPLVLMPVQAQLQALVLLLVLEHREPVQVPVQVLVRLQELRLVSALQPFCIRSLQLTVLRKSASKE
jgi:hypothetical protein